MLELADRLSERHAAGSHGVAEVGASRSMEPDGTPQRLFADAKRLASEGIGHRGVEGLKAGSAVPSAAVGCGDVLSSKQGALRGRQLAECSGSVGLEQSRAEGGTRVGHCGELLTRAHEGQGR